MMPSDPIQAMEFAQSKGQAHKEGRTGITLADVAGLDPIVDRLQQVTCQACRVAGHIHVSCIWCLLLHRLPLALACRTLTSAQALNPAGLHRSVKAVLC